MSYEFECIVPGCEGKVERDSVEEILQWGDQHANDVHGMTELDDATVEAVKAAIVEKA